MQLALGGVITALVFCCYVCVSFKFDFTSFTIQVKPHRTLNDVTTPKDMQDNFDVPERVSFCNNCKLSSHKTLPQIFEKKKKFP